MIETTYIRLEQAAAMLDTDADTLLIAAAEGRMRLYAVCGKYLLIRVGYADQEGWHEYAKDEQTAFRPKVSLLSEHGALDIMRDGVTADYFPLLPEDFHHGPDDGRELTPEEPDAGRELTPEEWGDLLDSYPLLPVTRGAILVQKSELARLKTQREKAGATERQPDRAHVSDWLALLNQASRKWWANASKDDPTTHPVKSDVVAWLVERGMNESLAKHAATIIRPAWGHVGRKPGV